MARSKTKERLPLHQIIFFSVGHVMNDLIHAIYSSYLLTFQTKILELPSNIIGYLWFIPCAIDAPFGLLIGYLSDNYSIPILSKLYGRRKSWHLLGCSLVGVFTPFILIPCFICGEQKDDWIIVAYYVVLLVGANAGWGITQANFLALIPEIAKRQSEMVKLGAISSAITLIGGIYVYVVTWVLLGANSGDTLSFKQWKEFMNLVIIVVGTGAFFAIIFHVGTREPNAKKGNTEKKPRRYLQNQEKKRHEFSMQSYEESKTVTSTSDSLYETAHVCSVSDVIQGKASTAIVNASFEEEEEGKEFYNYDKLDSKKKNEFTLDVAELENHLWHALSEHHDTEEDKYKADEVASVESSGYGGDSSLDGTDVESVEICMPETFIDMVPNHSAMILSSRRGSSRVSPFPSPKLSRSASKRVPRSQMGSESVDIHPHSSGEDYGVSRKVRSRLNSETQESPFPSPRVTRSLSDRFFVSPLVPEHLQMHHPSGIDPKIRSRLDSEIQESPLPSSHSSNSTSSGNCKESSLALESSNSNFLEINDSTLQEVNLNYMANKEMEKETSKANDIDSELTIIDRSKGKSTRRKSWRTLFKNPVFYKLGVAYMFTRLSQTIVSSYLPMYLTDHLKFEKASIAYFPLVILISGVFASIAAKKLNKLLGNKWTFVVGAMAVIGGSGWFCLLTAENRSFAYIPAIVSGCGTSIMFVTTLALAAEFVDADRSSGAFLMASMGFFAKIFLGVLFGLLQEFAPEKTSPDCPECTQYVRYVFSLTPGVCAFLGVIAFVLFIPATIQCRPIAETVDAETQTDGLSFNEPGTNTLEVIKDYETKTEPVSAVFRDQTIQPDIEVKRITNEAGIIVEVPESLDTRF
ncbi:uncharacterized protein LOC116297596 [Actinia tenebrosa]|uniref:Uncharacterized protein LOC116297596 n=1 Tax=Actinia tenebrosa TaxID=6105 RepID=A0A6P8I9C1_ACTTE|nr:uncharacterized protein LOC116297596 [Actinia tenebrosa]